MTLIQYGTPAVSANGRRCLGAHVNQPAVSGAGYGTFYPAHRSPSCLGVCICVWRVRVIVTDREQELRAEAAKCLRLAQTAKDPNVRAELTTMAQRFVALTRRPAIDFEALVDLYNEQQVVAPANPVMQQQQQPPNSAAPDGAAPSGAAGAEQTSFPRPPICPTCGKVMRLAGSSPAIRYSNLDQLRYACDCGGTAEKTVAHGD
jgi:hypothetical protein